MFLLVLFFLLILLFTDLKPGHPEVTRTLAVAILMATWWVTEAIPLSITALIPLVAFPMLGILNGKEVSTTYINHIIFIFIGGFIMALAMEKWNLHKRIALLIIRTIGSGPSRIILGFMAAAAFLSMWISNTATSLMLLPVALAVLEKTEDPKLATPLLLGIAYALVPAVLWPSVIKLVEAAGMRGFHAGMINNSAAAEALTSVLITINKQYGCHAGITISGLDSA